MSHEHLFVDIQSELHSLHIIQAHMFKFLPEEEFQKQMTARKLIKRLETFLEKVDAWNNDELRNTNIEELTNEAARKR